MAEPAGGRVPVVWVVAAALLLLLPNFSASPFADIYDSQRLLEIAVIAVAGVGVALVPRWRDAWLQTWARVPVWAAASVACLLALGVASAALAARPLYAFAEVASFVGMGVVAVGMAAAGREGARAGLALAAVVMLGGYAVSVLPFHLADLATGAAERWPDRHAGFGNVRQLNQLQAWLLPVVWALAADARSARARSALRVIAAATMVFVIASNGRGILLALAGGLLVSALVVRSERRAMAREAAISAVLGVALWLVLFAGVTALDKMENGGSGRVTLWAGALRMAAAHPVLGVGPMHYALYPVLYGAHPHNLVLQLAAEWGVPAALLAVVLGAASAWAWVRHARRATDGLWTAGCTAGVAAALINAMVDGFVIAPASQLVAALCVGALLSAALPERRPVAVRWPPRLALGAAALSAVGVLVAVVVQDAPTLERRPYDFRAGTVSPAAVPRFWSTGQIAPLLPADYATFWPDDGAPEHANTTEPPGRRPDGLPAARPADIP